jgi:PhnB protein
MQQGVKTTQIQPYLFFEGRAEEALEFYKKVLGATDVMMMRYKDSPEKAGIPPGAEDKIMHMNFRIGDSTIMGSDGYCKGQPKFQGFSLSLTVKSEAEAEKTFTALGEGGSVQQPLIKTFFSPRFGMLTDKFGVGWMLMVHA